MLDKKLIFELSRKRHKQSEIASIMGVSKQRINQILTGYKTVGSMYLQYKPKFRRHKNSIANRIETMLDKPCKICDEPARVIHHIDHNSHNNDIKNLLALCIKCHQRIHVGDKRNTIRNFSIYICKECGKTFKRNKGSAYKGLFCSQKCLGKSMALKSNQWSINYLSCVVCSTTKIKHMGRGLCRNCYARYWLNKNKKEHWPI